MKPQPKPTRIQPVVINPGGQMVKVTLGEALRHFDYRNDQHVSRGRSDRELFRGLIR